jgi:hypothetical protein
VVRVLVTGPKVRGFKPGRGRQFLKPIKIRTATSFGGEVKSSALCRKIFKACREHYKNEKRCVLR